MHTNTGNCYEVADQCPICGQGVLCPLCHEHNQERGECTECIECATCIEDISVRLGFRRQTE